MYTHRVTYAGSSLRVDESPSRGSGLYGFRVVPVLATGQDPATAFAGLILTYAVRTNALPTDPGFDGDTAVEVSDTSTFRLYNAQNLRITAGPVGQQYDVTILETALEDLEPDAAGGASSGSGVTPVVTPTIEQHLNVNSTAPTSAADGADLGSLGGARAVGLSILSEGGTFNAGGFLRAYGYLLGAWTRLPELDLSGGELAGQQVVTFDPIVVHVGGTTALAERIAWRPDGLSESDAGVLVTLLYQVTTPQDPAQVLTDLADPQGSLDLNAATTNPPTTTADGVDLAGADGLQLRVDTGVGSTIDPAGSLAAFYLPPGSSVWSRWPDADLTVALSTYTTGTRRLLFWGVKVATPAGRIAYRPANMALTGVGTTVDLNYRVADSATPTLPSAISELALATPTAADPSASTAGISLDGVGAVRVTVKSTNGTDTLDVGGTLAAWLYVAFGGSSYWSRAPDLDLSVLAGGFVSLTFGDLAIDVPAGRLAYRPLVLPLTPPGGTVDITYQPAAD